MTIKYQSAFRKDYKRIKKRGYDVSLLKPVLEQLMAQKPLDKRYSDHQLTGNLAGCRECHITPDWLLVYEINQAELILYLMRTGTHSDIFG